MLIDVQSEMWGYLNMGCISEREIMWYVWDKYSRVEYEIY